MIIKRSSRLSVILSWFSDSKQKGRCLYDTREKKRKRERQQVSGNGSGGSSSKETLTSWRNEFTFVEDDKLDLVPRTRSIRREVAWKFSPLGIPGFSLSITKITRDVHRETGPGIRVNVANAGRDGNFPDPSRFQPRHAWKLPDTGGIMEYAYLAGFHEYLVKFISFVSFPKLRILSAGLSQISIYDIFLRISILGFAFKNLK